MNVENWVCAAVVLWVPGAAILRLTRHFAGDRASRVATQLALGIAFWPIIFLWTSLLPLHWTSFAVRSVVGICAVIAFFPGRVFAFVRSITFSSIVLLIVLVVTGRTRLATIDAVVVPPWVDSVHHTMLVRLFLMRGTVPSTYDPFIPGATAFYHWGYHAVTAVLCWFMGRTEPFSVASTILSFGQFLNALAPLFVYAAAVSLLRSRTAAVIAAAVAGLVSYYPAYYVSWGRYTHLAGVLLLLAWMALAGRVRRLSIDSAVILAIVASGLVLVHVRLAFFGVMYAVVLCAAAVLRGQRRRVAAVVVGGALAAIIVLPWLVEMRKIAPAAIAPNEARWTSPADVRENLLWVPHTAELLSVATAGLSGMANIGPLTVAARVLSFVWWLAIVVIAMKRRRARPLIRTYAILAAWCALTLLVLNGTHLQFATNTSAAITAFIPISIAAAGLVAWVIAPVRRIGLVVVAVIACVIGLATLSHVINPSTVIATKADIAALHWIHTTPPSSTVIGHMQPWYGGAFIGVDGAYWSSVLADRRSLPPPSLYGWSGSFGEMSLFFARWQDEYPFVTRATLAEAKHLGVTHVYFGRGTPPEAARRIGPIVYARDGITIAALQ